MKDTNTIGLGIYVSTSFVSPAVGIGWNNFGDEKYLNVELLFWSVAIGRTGR